MNRMLVRIVTPLLMLAMSSLGRAQIAPDPNSAMNDPDRTAWALFLKVNQQAGSAALFETWASDTDTFRPNPTFPAGPSKLQLHVPIVPFEGRASLVRAGKLAPALAPGASSGVMEETRRNQPAFDFIVRNGLFSKSGLKAAYGKTLTFPIDSLEVKANWIPVADIPAFTLNRVSAAEVETAFHVSADKNGAKYALVSMHVISKLVPNWTWATFENRYNPARCDILGCKDRFGSGIAVVPPNKAPGAGYADCPKTPALLAMFGNAQVGKVFANYCLKGAQADFQDDSGLAIRLGNSITEQGFVDKSSCMTCHSRAAWNGSGAATTSAGFDPDPPLGAMQPAWYWKTAAKPPIYQGMPGLVRIATGGDFVWSIPFCAYDDSDPGKPKKSSCAGK